MVAIERRSVCGDAGNGVPVLCGSLGAVKLRYRPDLPQVLVMMINTVAADPPSAAGPLSASLRTAQQRPAAAGTLTKTLGCLPGKDQSQARDGNDQVLGGTVRQQATLGTELVGQETLDLDGITTQVLARELVRRLIATCGRSATATGIHPRIP